ncbi:MAG: hypothetical protein ACQERB_10285 [Promethearchaeati archaeon]
MGFASSLIILSVLGLFSHYFYRRFGIAKGKLAWISYFTLFVNLGFLILDILIYAGFFNFLFPIFNNLPWVFIENGKDFMWNSFQLIGVNWSIPYNTASLNTIAIFLFISYPIWFMFFKDFSRKIFGGNEKRPYTKGISFLFTYPKKTEDETDFAKKPELGD